MWNKRKNDLLLYIEEYNQKVNCVCPYRVLKLYITASDEFQHLRRVCLFLLFKQLTFLIHIESEREFFFVKKNQ